MLKNILGITKIVLYINIRLLNRRRSSNFVGVPGKGGHFQTNYRTTVSYNNEHHTFTGSSMYHRYKEGDKVKVKVTHYPYYSIDIVN